MHLFREFPGGYEYQRLDVPFLRIDGTRERQAESQCLPGARLRHAYDIPAAEQEWERCFLYRCRLLEAERGNGIQTALIHTEKAECF